MNIRPLGDRVLVEPIEEKEQTVGGIYIPDSAKEKPMQGKVLAVGKKLDKDGKEIKFDVKKGDTVLLPKYGRRATRCFFRSTAAPRSSSTAKSCS